MAIRRAHADFLLFEEDRDLRQGTGTGFEMEKMQDELGGKIQHRTEVICGVGDDAEGEGGGATTDVDKEQKRMKNHQLLAVCPRLRLRERYKKGMCGTFTATAADTATSAASNGVVGMWCAVP